MIRPTARASAAMATALLTVVLLVACGSSASTTSSTTSTSASAAASGGSAPAARSALRTCLEKHGVTLPKRPAGSRPPGGYGGVPGAGGFFGGGGASGAGGAGGGFRSNPKLAAAFRACGGFRFRGSGRRFTISHAAITNFVTCVRAHGYPAMPSPNFSGGAVFPASIRTNPAFIKASRACAAVLRPATVPGGPGGAGAPAPAGSGTTTNAAS